MKYLIIFCIIPFSISLLLNLYYMAGWSTQLRTQYMMGFDDGKSSAIEYWEGEIQRIKERNIRDFVLRELNRTQASQEYITMMEGYFEDGLGWGTGVSNAD